MSDLSPELQQLFRAAGHASLPTDADRQRVFNGLQARLGIAATVGVGVMSTAAARGTTRALVGKTAAVAVAALVMVAGGGASTYFLTHRSVPEVVNSPKDSVVVREIATTHVAAETSTMPLSLPLPQEAATIAIVEPPKAVTPASSVRRSARVHDNLAEEAAILARAQSELHSGRPSSSLKVLTEYDRKFKHGILTQERTAVKIQALCALGRGTEANALMGGLSPQSLTGESARQACSSTKNVAPRR